MDVARRIYSRDLKIAAMREIDGGRRIGEVARHLEVSPHLLERWRGEWQARGELAFPGIGRRGVSPAAPRQRQLGIARPAMAVSHRSSPRHHPPCRTARVQHFRETGARAAGPSLMSSSIL